MEFWGKGYKQGYRDAAMKIKQIANVDIDLEIFMEGIYKDADMEPSSYAVSNKCCGGVDAHSVGCGRK